MSVLEKLSLASGEIFGTKTFEGGSAKIQRIPLMPDIFNANSLEELLEALAKAESKLVLAQFTSQLKNADGEYSSSADAIANLVAKSEDYLAKLRSGTLKNKEVSSIIFAMKYIYSAMFKTAGNLTMFWGAWTERPSTDQIILSRGTNLGLLEMGYTIQIPTRTFNVLSQTNQIIYNILVSLLNQASDDIGNLVNVQAIRQRVIDISTQGLGGVKIGFGSGKESIKIDYKLDKNGRAAVVDINAGNMGIPDGGDNLGNKLRQAVGLEKLKVTDAVIEAVMASYNANNLKFPQDVSIMVLDKSMYDLNKLDVDMYTDAIKSFAASRGLDINVNIVFTDGESIIPIQGQLGNNVADLIFRYTNRTQIGAQLRAELDKTDTMVIPEPYTNLIADKVSGQIVGNLGKEYFPEEIIIPQEVQSMFLTGDYDGESLVNEAFSVGQARSWDGIVIKTATKFRKSADDGRDFPTAFVYPLTEIGKTVAIAEMKSLLNKLVDNPNANYLPISFNQLFTGSLTDESGISRQAEIRLISTLEP